MSLSSLALLRKQMRHQRRALSTQQQRQAAQRMAQQLFRQPRFRQAQQIACYLANDGEINLNPLIQRLWRQHKQLYLPVLHPRKRSLWFLPYTATSRLHNNRFGIPEPAQRHQARPVWALDLVLLPLIAFDNAGNRLGMGGGFYDATLACLRRRQRRPQLVGVAFEFQHLAQLPVVNAWDIPLQGAVTDRAYYRF